MRQFKFRIWDKEKAEWFLTKRPFSLFGECVLLGGLFSEINSSKLDNYIIQQFTGLLDKNGKEIYEGDVLKADEWVFNPKTEEYKIYRENAICHIWYANPCSYIAEWAVSFNHLYSESSCKFENLRNVEVIGNIFESPELLS